MPFWWKVIERNRKNQYNITIDTQKSSRYAHFRYRSIPGRGKDRIMATVLEDRVSAIPPEVLGDDLVDVRPLGQQGGFSNLFHRQKSGLKKLLRMADSHLN